jgi:hypothetical protein
MLHERKCWSCGNVANHTDNIVPAVLCKKCGSQDTRPLKASKPALAEAAKHEPDWQWREADASDIGRLAKFSDFKDTRCVYGILVHISTSEFGAPVYHCDSKHDRWTAYTFCWIQYDARKARR